MAPLEERTEYPYQNIRVKNFPWGDGDKVCSSIIVVDQLLTNVLHRPFCKSGVAETLHTPCHLIWDIILSTI